MIKKILLVSKFSTIPQVYTYATSFQRSLELLGYHVEIFNCKKNFLHIASKNHDALHPWLKQINNLVVNYKLIKTIGTCKPDLIFFVKAENITYKTIRTIKRNNQTLLVNFYPDNPFVFWNGNSNHHILTSLPLYDYFLIWSKMLMPALESAGAKNVYYFPFAYDENIFNQSIIISPDNQKRYQCDVCFIGTWDSEREQSLTELCSRMPTLNLAIWGNLWDQQLKSSHLLRSRLRGKAIYGAEMIKAFRCTTITLNFIRQQNKSSHNMRTCETLASNVFMLTQRTKEQAEELFTEGESIECFETIDELIKKIEFYLKNDNLRIKIAQKGFEASKKFSMTRQLKNFLDYVRSCTS